MAETAHLCQMLVYTLLSFQDSGEIKKQLDWWVGCQNFSPVSIMQLNIASPFFDKYWNISRNHTSFFPRWWSSTSPNLSKKYWLLFILHVRSAIQTLQMGVQYVFLHYQSVFSLQWDLPTISRFFSLFPIHYGSEEHLFQKQQLTLCQVNALITQTEPHLNFFFDIPFFFFNFCIIHARQKYQKSNWIYEKHLFLFL